MGMNFANQIERICSKGLSEGEKGELAHHLKAAVEELMLENKELKSRADKVNYESGKREKANMADDLTQ